MRTMGSEGPLPEDDEEGTFTVNGHDLSHLPWQHPADLVGGSHAAHMQDSMVEDFNAATSFVMRSSPFQAGALTPSRRQDGVAGPRAHERLSDRAQERSFDGRLSEAESALVSAQQWLPPCDVVPEENLEQSLSQPEPQPAVGRHRGSQAMLPLMGTSPEDESLFHGSAGGLCDSLGVALDDKPQVRDPDAGIVGAAADDTDADFGEPVQPLRPRTRGLPGNTVPVGTENNAPISSNAIEKKLRQPAEKPQHCPAPGVDGAGAPPPPPPHETIARHHYYGSPLCDAGVTVQAAAAAVNMRDMAELRSFRNPPAVVCQVLEAVAVLLGVEDVRWAKMRKLLDKDFVAKIRTFDPSSTTLAQAERLAVILQVPTFSDGLLGERCPAVLSLATWCNAVGRHLEAPLPAVAPPPMPLPSSGGRTSRRENWHGQLGGGLSEVDNGSVACLQRPDMGGLEVEPDLWSLSEEELAHVSELKVSRAGVGAVTFHGITDCRGLAQRRRLLEIIILNPGEVVVYPNQLTKPQVGVGLNKPASVCLFGCLPKAQGFKDRRARERYKRRVRQMTEDKGAEFVDYDCDEGIWQFRVAHF